MKVLKNKNKIDIKQGETVEKKYSKTVKLSGKI